MLFFCLFRCFEEQEYQTKSKRNETFRNLIFSMDKTQETWTLRQDTKEEATRGSGAPPYRARPCLVGPSGGHQRTSSSYISLRTPKTSSEPTKHNFHHRNLLYPRDPILEPSPALRRRGNQPRRASTSTP